MKNVYIVCYDITDSTRWKIIFRLMKGYGDAVQLSVFRCALTPELHLRLVDDLRHSINEDEDKVLVIDLGPLDGRGDKAMTILGKPIMDVRRGPIIL